jgi:hypothetical protein
MKLIYLFLFWWTFSLGVLLARSEMFEQNTIFRQIAMSLQEDNTGRSLGMQNRFDDVDSIKQMVKRSPYF